MKFFATLMLMLAFGLSVVYSQDISDDDASLDVQQFVDRVMKGQVDDEDDEIVDMDDAWNKLRMLRKVYRIVSEVEAEDSLYPRKRFIVDTFKAIKDKILEAAKKAADYFKKTWSRAKDSFESVISKIKKNGLSVVPTPRFPPSFTFPTRFPFTFPTRMPWYPDFEAIVAKARSYIHSGMSVAACKKAIADAATAILGPAASHVGSLSGPICDGALAKLEQAAG